MLCVNVALTLVRSVNLTLFVLFSCRCNVRVRVHVDACSRIDQVCVVCVRLCCNCLWLFVLCFVWLSSCYSFLTSFVICSNFEVYHGWIFASFMVSNTASLQSLAPYCCVVVSFFVSFVLVARASFRSLPCLFLRCGLVHASISWPFAISVLRLRCSFYCLYIHLLHISTPCCSSHLSCLLVCSKSATRRTGDLFGN